MLSKRRCSALTLAVAALALSGCSSGNPSAPARISGKISYAGKPLKAGVLRFHTAQGNVYDGLISPDGTYTATDLPVGELIITVETESINPANVPGGGAKMSAENERRIRMMGKVSQSAPAGSGGSTGPTASDNYMKIPDKFNNSKTSPLSVTLERGRQVKNIELTD